MANQSVQAERQLLSYLQPTAPTFDDPGVTFIGRCADVLSVVAAVESGRGVAVVGEFITAVVGDRVRFVPFVSDAHFLEVGLLYPQREIGENIKKLVAAFLAGKQPP